MDKLGIQVEGDSLDRKEGQSIAAGMKLANILTGGKSDMRSLKRTSQTKMKAFCNGEIAMAREAREKCSGHQPVHGAGGHQR
jgi:hypothetical protein